MHAEGQAVRVAWIALPTDFLSKPTRQQDSKMFPLVELYLQGQKTYSQAKQTQVTAILQMQPFEPAQTPR